GQLGSHLPVVLEVGGEVDLFVVGLVDVGGVNAVGAAGKAKAIRIGIASDGGRRGGRRQQHLGHSARGATRVRNIRKATIVLECTPRPGRLQGGKLHVLVLDAHLEAVFAVDLGEVVGDLDGCADFVRREEVVAAQIRQ